MIRSSLAVLLTLLATLTLGALSRIPWQPARSDHATLRLAWRASDERFESCRQLTPEELEKIPAHMRRDTVCTDREVPYRLEVAVNGTPLANELVHAAGVRRDRPLYVFREFPLAPGAHQVRVGFFRTEEVSAGEREAGKTPARLAFDSTVTLVAGEILLVTYDPELRQLVVEKPSKTVGR
jgi:hypothetical protein